MSQTLQESISRAIGGLNGWIFQVTQMQGCDGPRQTKIVLDLMKAHIDEAGSIVHYEAPAISVEGCELDTSGIIYGQNDERKELLCIMQE